MKYRVVLRETLHRELSRHLLSGFSDEALQEEACLALWQPGDGLNRYTGILGEVVLPEDGERDLHGNVTVGSGYLNRVLDRALQHSAGVAVLHSHPEAGWQALSATDDDTERRVIAPFVRETRLPLLGLTIGSDGVWSARFWQESEVGSVTPVQCRDVRLVGSRQTLAHSPPHAYPPYSRRPNLVRTIDSWGIEAQARLARTHVCVVGAGSVGSIVLESLARIGFEEITIIDPDTVELGNLDRLVYADRHCLRLRKVEVAANHLRGIATARQPVIRPVPLSICTERAYRLAADADVILCCVDSPDAREALNHVAYANCLPLIDGGVFVESRDRLLSAKWCVHLAGPDMRCLRCRGQYSTSDASAARMGNWIGRGYITDGREDGPRPGQNTIAFCNVVAAEEIRILVRYLIGERWWHDEEATAGLWSFEHRFVEAEAEAFEHPGTCAASCEFAHKRLGLGQHGHPPYGFTGEPKEGWRSSAMRNCRRARMKIGRAFEAIRH